MPSQSTIRPAQESDFDAINSLYATDNAEYAARHPKIFKDRQPRPLLKGDFINSLDPDEKEWTFLVAEAGDEVVGVIELSILSQEESRIRKTYRAASVDELIVAKQFRKQGIATDLLRAGEGWARQLGLQEIGLTVYAFRSEALRLYEKNGFSKYSLNLVKELD